MTRYKGLPGINLPLRTNLPATFSVDRPAYEPAKTEPAYYFAFAVTPGGSPQVFVYENTEDGLAGLANLIRAEHVLKVVKGQAVDFRQASVVELRVGNQMQEHRLTVSGGD